MSVLQSIKVEVELSVRADKDLVDGDEIPIQLIVRLVEMDGTTGLQVGANTAPSTNTLWQDFATDITLTVRDLTTANDPSTAYTAAMRNIDE